MMKLITLGVALLSLYTTQAVQVSTMRGAAVEDYVLVLNDDNFD